MLEVNHLSISFLQYKKGLKQQQLKVIKDLSVSVHSGEILAVVGSSGSGKSLLAHAILGILPTNATTEGTIYFDGGKLTPEKQEELRGKEISFVPQSVNFLDPLMRVGTQVRTAARGASISAQRKAFERFRLAKEVEKKFPFQLSGGMARRVLASTAMVSGAKLILADEPTPGMDPTVIKEALKYFRELADSGCAVLMITHDIGAALEIADKIAVFYAGTTVETAMVDDFSGNGSKLRHPYSKALWRALPQNDFVPIPGSQPLPYANLPGCLFEPRCTFATAECRQDEPKPREIRNGIVRCIHAT